MIASKLQEYIATLKGDLFKLSKKEGTRLLTERIVAFCQLNNIQFRQEVPLIYDSSKKGRLDFVLYDKAITYPIEIDTIHKGSSFRKLLTFSKKENYFPIWIRWSFKSDKDNSIEGIFIIDITTELLRVKDITQLELDNVIPFGIYKGIELRKLILNNPKYVRWCIENIYLYQLSLESITLLEEVENNPSSSNSS